MEANFKFQKEENKVFIFGIWDKTSVSKIKIKDLLSQISQTNCIFDFSQLNEID
ncbi:ABC transporter permease, partial [Campylobacter coli]|nr:ABC transporter permease [Campylobacter coli]